jgi:hypothetical protein
MEKLKGYLGVALALVLVTGFVPVPRSFHYAHVSKLTPLDLTLAGQLVSVWSAPHRFWWRATNTLNACKHYGRNCDYLPELFLVQVGQRAAEFEIFEPALPALMRDYEEAWRTDGELRYRDAAARTASRDPQLVAFERQLGSAVEHYLESQRSTLAGGVYGIHVLLLVLVVTALRWRRRVGGVLLWPLSLALRAAKTGAAVAVDVHRKV